MAQAVIVSKKRSEKLTSRVKAVKKESIISSTTAAKTIFEKDCERAVSVEQGRRHTHKFINNLWKKEFFI
jgi:hypothetical protein